MMRSKVSARWRSRPNSEVRCWTRSSRSSVRLKGFFQKAGVLQGDGYLIADGTRQLQGVCAEAMRLFMMGKQDAMQAALARYPGCLGPR